jgi:hypothetical protein
MPARCAVGTARTPGAQANYDEWRQRRINSTAMLRVKRFI